MELALVLQHQKGEHIMYHLRFKGSHYHAGYTFGKRLKKHGREILKIVPFTIDEKRIAFAKDCEPFYQTHYPQILEEIKGLADGQQASYDNMLAVLLSMYCIMPEQKCTNVCMHTNNGVYLARNSDFLVSLEKEYLNCIYKLDYGYHFTGNTTAFIEMEDGINEYGLAVGLTSVYPTVLKPGMNAGMILRYLLEKCKTVDEAVMELKRLPIASSQTFAIADATGAYEVIECNCEKLSVLTPTLEEPFVLSVNAFYSNEMKHYQIKDETIDDWRQQERYFDTKQALMNHQNEYSLEFLMRLMSGNYGFICQYDRLTDADTVWSVVYDVMHKKIYRVEGNPQRKQFQEDTRFTFHSSLH